MCVGHPAEVETNAGMHPLRSKLVFYSFDQKSSYLLISVASQISTYAYIIIPTLTYPIILRSNNLSIFYQANALLFEKYKRKYEKE